MARKSPFDRLADLAGNIDALNKKADALARKLVRARTSAEETRISRSGAALEKQLRKLERSFRETERRVLSPQSSAARRPSVAEREAEEASILEQVRVGQRFHVQATYRRKNHRLVVDIILIYVGLPVDTSTIGGENRVRRAVRQLANGEQPPGFAVERIAYDPKEGVTVRRNSELDKIKGALESNNTEWTIGEL